LVATIKGVRMPDNVLKKATRYNRSLPDIAVGDMYSIIR